MTQKPWFRLAVLVVVFLGLAVLLKIGARSFGVGGNEFAHQAPGNSILQIDLEGIILNGRKFLKTVETYSKDENIKAVVININSPGGAVGPSQEIHAALTRWREEAKIPIVCASTGLMASGAYYSAVACDRIVVAPGALVGSIGVIMEFANLGKLYDWAKVSRYSITTGKYKDSGAEYRDMREDERQLFQELINEVYGQFKEAVAQGRPKLKEDILTEYADGRVFTGAKAVQLGFADDVGTLHDAVKIAANLAKLGDDYELYKPSKPRRSFWHLDWMDKDEDSLNGIDKVARRLLKTEALNRPLYLMPGTWEEEQ